MLATTPTCPRRKSRPRAATRTRPPGGYCSSAVNARSATAWCDQGRPGRAAAARVAATAPLARRRQALASPGLESDWQQHASCAQRSAPASRLERSTAFVADDHLERTARTALECTDGTQRPAGASFAPNWAQPAAGGCRRRPRRPRSAACCIGKPLSKRWTSLQDAERELDRDRRPCRQRSVLAV